jgi:hypothetical protein
VAHRKPLARQHDEQLPVRRARGGLLLTPFNIIVQFICGDGVFVAKRSGGCYQYLLP